MPFVVHEISRKTKQLIYTLVNKSFIGVRISTHFFLAANNTVLQVEHGFTSSCIAGACYRFDFTYVWFHLLTTTSRLLDKYNK